MKLKTKLSNIIDIYQSEIDQVKKFLNHSRKSFKSQKPELSEDESNDLKELISLIENPNKKFNPPLSNKFSKKILA